MADTVFTTQWGSLELQRQPQVPNLPLQAWDGADAYLLETITDAHNDITVVNDAFGALTLMLASRTQQSWSDSALARHACKVNAEANGQDSADILSRWVPTSEVIEAPKGLIVMKIPKSMALLNWQLSVISALAPEGAELWLAGMDKHIRKSQFDAVAHHFGPVTPMLGRKKARIWQATNAKKSVMPVRFTDAYVMPGTEVTLSQTPGIFCGHQIDIGSRVLLDYMKKVPDAARVGDLGCGNGLLGLSYLRRHPETEMVMVDESAMAVACATENVNRVMGTNHSCKVLLSDGMNLEDELPLDLILCNPPFHQGTTVNTEMAIQLFHSALDSLRPNGQFWVVANRHLHYHVVLKSLFGNCTTAIGDDKFVILMAHKPEELVS